MAAELKRPRIDRVARNKQIVADRVAGMKYNAIAAKYGLTLQYVHNICERAYRAGDITSEQMRRRVKDAA